MTGISTTFNPVNDIIVLIVFLGGLITYTRSRIPSQTIKNLQDLTVSYEKRIKTLEDELANNHKIQLENVGAISDLQGQVKVYKELPLRELADGIKNVVEISKDNAESNKQILVELRNTAKINAEDRDVLTNQNLHIQQEVDKKMAEK